MTTHHFRRGDRPAADPRRTRSPRERGALLLAVAVLGCERPSQTGELDPRTTSAASVTVSAPSETASATAEPAAADAGPVPASASGIVISRKGYQLTYPSDWELDQDDEDFDLDSYFAIDAPGNCHIALFFFPMKLDEQELVGKQAAKMKASVFKPGASETSFTTWGTLTGKGVELRGRMTPVGAGRVRAFARAEQGRSLMVSEFCFDEDLPRAQPGFDLVASTFRWR